MDPGVRFIDHVGDPDGIRGEPRAGIVVRLRLHGGAIGGWLRDGFGGCDGWLGDGFGGRLDDRFGGDGFGDWLGGRRDWLGDGFGDWRGGWLGDGFGDRRGGWLRRGVFLDGARGSPGSRNVLGVDEAQLGTDPSSLEALLDHAAAKLSLLLGDSLLKRLQVPRDVHLEGVESGRPRLFP